MTAATIYALYEVYTPDGFWFAIGTLDEIAALEADGVLPAGYTVKEY